MKAIADAPDDVNFILLTSADGEIDSVTLKLVNSNQVDGFDSIIEKIDSEATSYHNASL